MIPKKLSNFLKVFGERENLFQKGLAKNTPSRQKEGIRARRRAILKIRSSGWNTFFVFIIADFGMVVNTKNIPPPSPTAFDCQKNINFL